jgi:hypothetical protein
MPIRVECAPAFNYARSPHTMEITRDDSIAGIEQNKVLFKSDSLSLDLRYVPESTMENVPTPEVELHQLDLTKKGHLGLSACTDLDLTEGQAVTFVLRTPPAQGAPPQIAPNKSKADALGVSLDSE